MTGLIVKGIGGFYYVKTEDGIVEAKGKGTFKKDGIKLAVGDSVEVEILDNLSKDARKRGIEREGFITSICERKNRFIRPPIVNVDLFLIVFALKDPEPNLTLIDKFLIMAEMNNVEAVVVINKCDLGDPEEIEKYKEIYESVYPVITLCGSSNDELLKAISGKKVAFAGPSGVGKSTIINSLIPHANMETGEISEKTRRGRHTTRHVEIFDCEGGGMVFDTPGFTSFEILEAEEDDLMMYYPEIERYRSGCYYDNCRHIKEPDCAVRQAVRDGKINKVRYKSYVANMEEIRNRRKY